MDTESKTITLPVASGVGRPEELNCNLAIYGDHGGGKTTFVEEILLAKKKRLIIVDTLCKDYGNPAFVKATGIKYHGIYTDWMEFVQALSFHAGKSGLGGFRLILRCPGREMDVIEHFFKYSHDKKRSIITDTTLLVEEISSFMDSKNIPPALEDMLVYGRHSRNNLIGVARVPRSETHPLYRSQMEMFLSFRQTEETAIRFFSDFNAEKAQKLRTLERGRYELFRGDPQELLDFIEKP